MLNEDKNSQRKRFLKIFVLFILEKKSSKIYSLCDILKEKGLFDLTEELIKMQGYCISCRNE